MAYEAVDVTRDLTVALINKLDGVNITDEKKAAEWAAECYKIIYKSVCKPD